MQIMQILPLELNKIHRERKIAGGGSKFVWYTCIYSHAIFCTIFQYVLQKLVYALYEGWICQMTELSIWPKSIISCCQE